MLFPQLGIVHKYLIFIESKLFLVFEAQTYKDFILMLLCETEIDLDTHKNRSRSTGWFFTEYTLVENQCVTYETQDIMLYNNIFVTVSRGNLFSLILGPNNPIILGLIDDPLVFYYYCTCDTQNLQSGQRQTPQNWAGWGMW